jgi:hypothetical protein
LSAAEIQFRKASAPEGKKALVQYEADAHAARKKTERLKALRLARDAEEAAARPPAAEKKRREKKVAPAQAEEGGATLTNWWKDQRDDGRGE